MKKHIPLIGGLVLIALLTAALVWWMQRERPVRPSPSEERLLTGFHPAAVKRVRIRYQGETVERVRHHATWELLPGAPTATPSVRLDVILARLARLRARPIRGRAARLVLSRSPVVEIKLWRGQARALLLRFYRQGRQVILTTTDRPGRYRVDPALLSQIERELKGGAAANLALTIEIQRLKTLTVRTPTAEVLLVHHGGRWFVADGTARTPADAEAVQRLIREVQGLRILTRLGSAKGKVKQYGLNEPRVVIQVDDGQQRTLRLGGRCPNQPGGVVAQLQGRPAVLCLNDLDRRVLRGPFVSRRVFSIAADEARRVELARGKRRLELRHRPGRGGWVLHTPEGHPVDPEAAAAVVSELTGLRARGVHTGQTPAPGAKMVGTVRVTPLSGPAQVRELWARGDTLWSRQARGQSWLMLPDEAVSLLAADPVVLRSRRVCTAPADDILGVSRTVGSHTEFLERRKGVWQLVILQGRRDLAYGLKVVSRLDTYQSRARGKGPSKAWRPPVLLVDEPDPATLSVLLHRIGRIRAHRYVAAKPTGAHDLTRRSPVLTYVYRHNCQQLKKGQRVCQQATCRLRLGARVAKGGCYAQRVGDAAVFLLGKATCSDLHLARRQVVATPLSRLHTVSVSKGKKRAKLTRSASGLWQRQGGAGRLSQERIRGALVPLTSLTALRVLAYASHHPARELVTVTLHPTEGPRITLRFLQPQDVEIPRDTVWLARNGRPVRYLVRASLSQRLRSLLP